MKKKVIVIIALMAIIGLIVFGVTVKNGQKNDGASQNSKEGDSTTVGTVNTSGSGERGGQNSKKGGKKGTRDQIKDVKVKNEEITKVIIVDGVVDFKETFKYYGDDEKIVKKLNIKVGDNVNAGDTVIVYDTDKLDTLKVNLKDEQLSVDMTKIEISKLKTVDNIQILKLQNDNDIIESTIKEAMTSITGKQNELVTLETSLKNAQQDLSTYQKLLDKGYASQNDITTRTDKIADIKNSVQKINQDIIDIKASIENKKAQKITNLKQIELYANKEKDPSVLVDISSKQKAIERSQLKIADLERQIKEYTTTCKVAQSGVVTSLAIEEGQSVTKGKELFGIADPRNMIITSNISEFDINNIKLGDIAKVTGDALVKQHQAYVSKIYPIANLDSNNNAVIPIELKFEKPVRHLRNNYKVTLEITKAPVGKSIMVPLAAIKRDTLGKSYVLLKNKTGEKPEQVEIKTGEVKGSFVEVFGISEKDQVVQVIPGKKKQNAGANFMQNLTGGNRRGPGR